VPCALYQNTLCLDFIIRTRLGCEIWNQSKHELGYVCVQSCTRERCKNFWTICFIHNLRVPDYIF